MGHRRLEGGVIGLRKHLKRGDDVHKDGYVGNHKKPHGLTVRLKHIVLHAVAQGSVRGKTDGGVKPA